MRRAIEKKKLLFGTAAAPEREPRRVSGVPERRGSRGLFAL